MAKIIGLGGFFFKAKNPLELSNWYKQYLGLDVLEWGGVVFPWKNMVTDKSEAYSLWAPFEDKTDYFSPSTQSFMINFVVDNLEEMVDQLKQQNQKISEIQIHDHGKFAWILDPEGNKVELWEPK